MVSLIGIYNAALRAVGSRPLTAPTDDTPAAELCRTSYEAVRDEVLELWPWPCAIKRAELAMDAETPVWGYDYQYTLPGDCLRVLETLYGDADHWQVEGRKLLTNETSCSIRYISTLEDVTLMTPVLAAAISARLAAEISPALGTEKTVKLAWELYERKRAEAQASQAQVGMEPELETPTWISERN